MPSLTTRVALVGLAACGLAACKDEKKPAGPAPAAASTAQRVVDAAEQSIQSSVPAPAKVKFRGVQSYAQAVPQRVAICGQVNPFADDANIFVPFVSVVTMQQAGELTQYQFDTVIGTSTSEASRVYAAIVTYCYENGGPAQAGFRTPAPTPPLPDSIGNPAAPPPNAALPSGALVRPVAGVPLTKAPIEASGTVVMRQSSNVHSDPKGPSIRTVPQGATLHVFGQAPGGWYQVGDTAPLGWVHESMLTKQ